MASHCFQPGPSTIVSSTPTDWSHLPVLAVFHPCATPISSPYGSFKTSPGLSCPWDLVESPFGGVQSAHQWVTSPLSAHPFLAPSTTIITTLWELHVSQAHVGLPLSLPFPCLDTLLPRYFDGSLSLSSFRSLLKSHLFRETSLTTPPNVTALWLSFSLPGFISLEQHLAHTKHSTHIC